MYRRIAEHYPNNQFAQYTTAHDSVQVYFYNLMLHIDRAIYDPEIWEQINPSVSERWHSTMLEHTRYVAEKASNYSYYIGSGADHTIMGFDKLYLESSAGVPFLTWLQDLLEGRSICVAPGILDRNSRT
jgi:predicted GIY-YIG superfamily endonuclease